MGALSTIKGLPDQLWRGWLSHSGVDLLVIPVVLGVHLVLAALWDAPALLDGIPVSSRPGLYGAAAVVVSLTGTLASVTVAQFLSGRGERMVDLKSKFPGSLARTWRGIFLGSVLAVTLFLTAYALDSRSADWHFGTWLFEAGALLAGLRFMRLTVLFGYVVELVVLDDTDPLRDTEFELNPDSFTQEAPRTSAKG
jgi:hypothetical protein